MFKFFQGEVKVRLDSGPLRFVQRRYNRIHRNFIPYPSHLTDERCRRLFRMGWRSCENGRAIHENLVPESSNSILMQERTAWESGWLSCYHNHPEQFHNGEHVNCYLFGWEAAQTGLPINRNPYTSRAEHSMWRRGWNTFVNTH